MTDILYLMQNFTTMFARVLNQITNPTAADNSTPGTYFFIDIPDIRAGDVLWPFTAVSSLKFIIYFLHDF